jgi:hypothetical protein
VWGGGPPRGGGVGVQSVATHPALRATLPIEGREGAPVQLTSR